MAHRGCASGIERMPGAPCTGVELAIHWFSIDVSASRHSLEHLRAWTRSFSARDTSCKGTQTLRIWMKECWKSCENTCHQKGNNIAVVCSVIGFSTGETGVAHTEDHPDCCP